MPPALGRICFATPGVYPLLAGRAVAVSGGSERRALSFLQALERTGRYDLSVIAFDHSRPNAPCIGPVRVIRDPVYAPQPASRFARARVRLLSVARRVDVDLPSETAAWEEADAQVYVAFGVGDYSAKLARWALSAGRHMVLVAGSDTDFSTDYRPGAVGRNPYGGDFALCREAIDRAGTIVVQTRAQQRLAAERFGRKAEVIANPIALADDDVQGVPSVPGGYALWIGKADRVKRPELALAVARACPEVRFKLVVNPADHALFVEVQRQRPENAEIIPNATPAAVASLFAEAFCLLNTSVFEGFPNTILEAGRHGVPVVSLTVDPDGIIARLDAGAAAQGNLDAFAGAVRAFHADRDAARRAGSALRAHVRIAHDACARFAEFEYLIKALVQHGSASPV